jgi:hypothetical protein
VREALPQFIPECDRLAPAMRITEVDALVVHRPRHLGTRQGLVDVLGDELLKDSAFLVAGASAIQRPALDAEHVGGESNAVAVPIVFVASEEGVAREHRLFGLLELVKNGHLDDQRSPSQVVVLIRAIFDPLENLVETVHGVLPMVCLVEGGRAFEQHLHAEVIVHIVRRIIAGSAHSPIIVGPAAASRPTVAS